MTQMAIDLPDSSVAQAKALPNSSGSEIRFKVALDKNKSIEKIEWEADEAGVKGLQDAKALFISVWDKEKNDTIHFSQWTKATMHHEMSALIFQSLLVMADTYNAATGNRELAGELQNFAEAFGEKAGIIEVVTEKDSQEDELKPFQLKL